MTINLLEIANKIEGNKKTISFFLKNLNLAHDGNNCCEDGEIH